MEEVLLEFREKEHKFMYFLNRKISRLKHRKNIKRTPKTKHILNEKIVLLEEVLKEYKKYYGI